MYKLEKKLWKQLQTVTVTYTAVNQYLHFVLLEKGKWNIISSVSTEQLYFAFCN